MVVYLEFLARRNNTVAAVSEQRAASEQMMKTRAQVAVAGTTRSKGIE